MSAPVKASAIDRARAAWGDELPDWIEALARACDDTSQSRVATRLAYSNAVVSNTLNAKYSGDLRAVEQAVQAHLMSATVDCPVVGGMAAATCNDHQKAPWSPRHALIREACHGGCPNSRVGGGS